MPAKPRRRAGPGLSRSESAAIVPPRPPIDLNTDDLLMLIAQAWGRLAEEREVTASPGI